MSRVRPRTTTVYATSKALVRNATVMPGRMLDAQKDRFGLLSIIELRVRLKLTYRPYEAKRVRAKTLATEVIVEDLSVSDPRLADMIVGVVESGNRSEISVDPIQSLSKYREAWSLLPEPRKNWDLAHWIASCFASLYFDAKEYGEAKKWSAIAMETKPPRETSSVIVFASACYELGETQLAYEHFDRVFKFGKKRAFEGFDSKYLDFYLDRSKG